MNNTSTPLKFIMPGWFAMVMGLSGLALAWHRATPLLGDMAGAGALVVGILALLVALVLAVLSLQRWRRYPQAVAEDLKHPVRHLLVAAMPISLVLLATLAVVVAGPSPLAKGVWALGSAWQFGVTVWVLSRWLRAGGTGPAFWATVTPALFVPVVGNVVPVLAGASLGWGTWAAAQFGAGLLLWPVMLALLLVRLAVSGPWPERLMPSTFITIAPPAVIGLGVLQLGAPSLLAWLAWGVALFFLAWSASVFQRVIAQPFSVMFWAMSFPLAAFSALTLRLAQDASGAFQTLAMVVLALSSLVVAALVLATIKGVRDGSLLAPEPVAMIGAAGPLADKVQG